METDKSEGETDRREGGANKGKLQSEHFKATHPWWCVGWRWCVREAHHYRDSQMIALVETLTDFSLQRHNG